MTINRQTNHKKMFPLWKLIFSVSSSSFSSPPVSTPGTKNNATPREDNVHMEVEGELRDTFRASNLNSGGSTAPGSCPLKVASDAKKGNPSDRGKAAKTANPLDPGSFSLRRSNSAESLSSSVSFRANEVQSFNINSAGKTVKSSKYAEFARLNSVFAKRALSDPSRAIRVTPRLQLTYLTASPGSKPSALEVPMSPNTKLR